MSSFNLTMIIVLIVVIIVLIIAVILIFNKKEVNTSVKKTSSSNKNVPIPYIDSVDFHPMIEKLGTGELHGIVRKVYDSYKIFDFKNMDANTYNKKEWHTWQVSMLLMHYKKNEEFFISNQDNIFPDSLLKLDSNSIKGLMTDIIKKYKNYIDINSTKDSLCKEYIWSYKDVSVIFYFLANYKKYKK